MRTEPKFVKPDDFFNYTGKDLKKLLRINDNESNMANIFLMQVEDKLLTRIDAETFRNTSWDNLTEFQKECLQKAIIIEAEYIIRNGDLFTDSGYNVNQGVIADADAIQRIAICRPAIDKLVVCGLYNHVMTNRNRYTTLS